MRLDELKPGVVLHVDREASVQFITREITFRLIKAGEDQADTGWVWLAGYQLNADGDAVERHDIYVQFSGLRPAGTQTRRRPSASR